MKYLKFIVLRLLAFFLVLALSAKAEVNGADVHLYVNAQSGSDSQNGASPSEAVKTLNEVLSLVSSKRSQLGSNDDLIVHIVGKFELQTLQIRAKHMGRSRDSRVIFRGEGGARLLGGVELAFAKASTLPSDNPGRKLVQSISEDILDKIWVADPPSNGLSSDDGDLRWKDGNCRDMETYASPPTLSFGGEAMDRAREPNLPQRSSFPKPEMGEVRDKWLRTTKMSKKTGIVNFAGGDRDSVNKAGDDSWNKSVWVHMFPQVDWFDARVKVGSRTSKSFKTNTKQKGPGDPNEGKNKNIVSGARFYLEGAVEYLDSPSEFLTSLGETDNGDSRGYTLFYPPNGIHPHDHNAVLSLTKKPIITVRTDNSKNAFVAFENLHLEGARRYLFYIEGSHVEFDSCSFVNAGHDAGETYGTNNVFRNCTFESTGGAAVRMSDDRDFDSDGKGFGLLNSGNVIVDSLISDFAHSCRHYCEGVSLGGSGHIVANNHFRSSNMAAIEAVGGLYKIMHNVFSHITDGSYDDGAIHWVAESPMERGTEVAYNVFFRNGVSKEPCQASTSCYQADIYMDDMAGMMAIHGNVFYKDKVLQPKPPSSKFVKINWRAILINGGADVLVYENSYVAPIDGSSQAITGGFSAFFQQTSGGTLWPDSKKCGNTGVCDSDTFYKRMTKYHWNKSPWADAFPELLNYKLVAQQDSGNFFCASTRSCPMASWNNTVVCNAGVGEGRFYAHRAIWGTDSEAGEDRGAAGKRVPKRSEALIETGNLPQATFTGTEAEADTAELAGMTEVLKLATRVALSAEAKSISCDKGTRAGAARSQLAGRGNNACTTKWSTDGFESCDPCVGSVRCADRDLSQDAACSCGSSGTVTPTGPLPAPSPQHVPDAPTKSPIKNISAPYSVYKNVGYCNSDNEKQFSKFGSADACWEKCDRLRRPYVEWLDGICYCQKTCPCMDDIDNGGRETLVPNGYELPNPCKACKDKDLKYQNKNKKNCKWVKKKKKCGKSWGGEKIRTYWCSKSCDEC